MFDTWKTVLNNIESKIDASSFVTWFKGVELVSIDDGVAKIGAPSVFLSTQLESRYKPMILGALNENNIEVRDVVFTVISKKKTTSTQVAKTSNSPLTHRGGGLEKITFKDTPKNISKTVFDPNLNPKYTMENFVMGANNDLAVSVAKYVVEHPGDKYNPFFLYGGPGLGKTHLVQAIGNELLRRNPKMKILYIPVSHFYSEFIDMIKKGRGDEFADKYRNLDALIIDDFQLIVGKDRSQEEFFNIFNDLYQANKQIIVTSDRLPSQIKTLDVRLSSRLSMAGAIDLQMPNFEDKCAILKCKAEFLGVEIEDEAVEYIAESVKTNIRDLESEFSKILAVSELRGMTPLQLIMGGYTATAQTGGRARVLNARQVIERVAKFYGLEVEEMCGKSRVANIKTARQVAMYFLSKELQMSQPKIALEVGVKDHTTVLHGIRKIEADIKENYQLREQIEAIKEKING